METGLAAPKRRRVLLVVLATVAAAAAVVVIFTGGSGLPQGPLADELGGAEDAITQPAPIGRVISASDLVVRNTGDHAVVLDRVELVGLSNGIYRGGYAVLSPFPRQVRGILTTYWNYHVPPYGRLLPGVTIGPQQQAYIVLALKAQPGQHQWSYEDIVYHDGQTRYRRRVAIRGAVCAPVKKYAGRCEAPPIS